LRWSNHETWGCNPQILMWSRTGPTNHGKSTGCIPRGCPTNRWVYPKVRQSGTDGKMKMNHHSLHGKMIGNTIGFGSTTVSDGYGSISINTTFRGMNIHKSQLFWCSPGVQDFDTLPHMLWLCLKIKDNPFHAMVCHINCPLFQWATGHGVPLYSTSCYTKCSVKI
jgi:hypothetical protein